MTCIPDMFRKFTAFKFTQSLIILVIGTQLSACGGGGSGGSIPVIATESSVAEASVAEASVVNAAPVTSDKSVQTGSFSLDWTAPVTRSDGTPLSLADINGYRIYYGTSPGVYPDVAQVSDGTATSATVTDVPLGTSYVVMTTNDGAGRESLYSLEVSKVVQ
jgi:hypothetical protein